MELNIIHNEDCRTGLRRYPDNFFHCCVTSPPYWGLRDYGVDGQLGLEETPEEYVSNMVNVFREVRRTLRDDGTLWLNIGDSYAGGGGGNYSKSKVQVKHGQHLTNVRNKAAWLGTTGLKPKDLVGIPWMLAFALRADGWYLRDCIIWHKPNPMPESVQDRTTKAHEYIFLLAKNKSYYYNGDAIREPLKDASIARLAQDIENQSGSSRVPGKKNGNMKAVRFGGDKYGTNEDSTHRTKSGKEWKPKMAGSGGINNCGRSGYFDGDGNLLVSSTANKKSVWTISTKPFKEAHFATFPEELPYTCISAGSPMGGAFWILSWGQVQQRW